MSKNSSISQPWQWCLFSRLLLQRLEVWSVCSSMIWLCLNCRSASRFWVTEADLWSMSSLGRAGSCSFSHQIYSTFLQLSKISSILLTPGCNRKQTICWKWLGMANGNRCDQLFIKFPCINRESKKPPPGTIQECWRNSGPSPQENFKRDDDLFTDDPVALACTGLLEGVLVFLDRPS